MTENPPAESIAPAKIKRRSDSSSTVPTEDERRKDSGSTGPKIIVVMPAYNAAKTLADTWQALPLDMVHEVLLVDDHSSDTTVDVAKTLPIRVIALPHNVGYGGNQKTCYLECLRLEADIIVMVHPDGQYDPALLPDLVAPIQEGRADIVFGSRMLTKGGARKGGMPLYRFVANKVLTKLENLMLGTSLSEAHTGYRAYSRSFLETVPFMRNSNDFVFDTQIISQAVAFDQRIVEVPIHTIYHSDASSTSMKANIVYGSTTLWTTFRYVLHRAGFRSRLFRK
jgi:glycosyltransferase involved in cell wall biosynthesis